MTSSPATLAAPYLPELSLLLSMSRCCSDAILLVHPTADDWQVLYSNEPCKRLLGVGAADLHGGNFWSMFEVGTWATLLC